VPRTFSSKPPTSGIGTEGCAICQRIISIKQKPRNKKASEVMPYWIPMTLWSLEKMYVRQNPASS